MVHNLSDPVVLCFALGCSAGLLRIELRFPESLYEALSIYLLITIGMKGGLELSTLELHDVGAKLLLVASLGIVLPILAFTILKYLGKFKSFDAAAIAAHYGSVSAVTFAVSMEYLSSKGIQPEQYSTLMMVLLEIPAIAVGIGLAHLFDKKKNSNYVRLFKEVFLGKAIHLLLGGVVVAWIAGAEKMKPIEPLFFGLFKGALALFLLEMGIVASRRVGDLKKVGLFLVVFALAMPFLSAVLAIFVAKLTGFSMAGTFILSALCASSSYIAAPAAMRIAVPHANPTYYLTASLGITFPFNLVFGIPIYFYCVEWAYRV